MDRMRRLAVNWSVELQSIEPTAPHPLVIPPNQLLLEEIETISYQVYLPTIIQFFCSVTRLRRPRAFFRLPLL